MLRLFVPTLVKLQTGHRDLVIDTRACVNHFTAIYLLILSRSISDHHLRCSLSIFITDEHQGNIIFNIRACTCNQ